MSRNPYMVLGIAALIVLAAVPLAAGSASAAQGVGRSFTLSSVSNPHPNLVSGDQVLLRVAVPSGVSLAQVVVTRNGVDVTSAFAAQPDGTLLGLVTGLRRGQNKIDAGIPGPQNGVHKAHLQVTNHSITGPVFSGPQQVPFICQTTAFGLDASVSPLCSAPTQVLYQYKTTGGAFLALANPAVIPVDATYVTVNGHSVPYIIRLEQGTIDRAVYQIAALYDGNSPNPLHPDASWNGRLVYTFGGGCDAGYHQGTATGGVTGPGADLFLSQGYAVASSTLNVLNTNCSTVISAEAAMMVKEHFIDTYGPVMHTIGWGGSGGAIQQYGIADAYPGILDGIIPSISFPNAMGTTLDVVSDCRLIDNFLGSNLGPGGPGNSFSLAQKTAIAGFNLYSSCPSWDFSFANRIQATASCDPTVPATVPGNPLTQWNPVTNPTGIGCSAAAQYVTQLGINPATGLVNDPVDNVGVQYGLAALDSGEITAAQFIELNQGIGGYDFAGNPQPQRSQADLQALNAIYADDLDMSGGLGLATTPIIDQRDDLDFIAGANIHTTDWSYVIRQRMIEHGTAANQVIIENSPFATVQNAYELSAMDSWLSNIEADTSTRSQQTKVAQDKPAGLGDGCFLTNSAPPILQSLSYHGTGSCPTAFPVAANPRLVAGQPLALVALKCQLKPLSMSDYPSGTFSSAQWTALQAVFQQGVCDYSQPGVGVQAPLGAWLNYGDTP